MLSPAFVQVRSLCLSSDGTKILVGTLGSDILELAAVEKQKGEDGEEEGEEEEARMVINAALISAEGGQEAKQAFGCDAIEPDCNKNEDLVL